MKNDFVEHFCGGTRWLKVASWLDVDHGFGDASCDLSESTSEWDTQVDGCSLVMPHQVHKADFVNLEEEQQCSAKLEIEADAITSKPPFNTAVGVVTADCIPVLLLNRETAKVAACHCGWRSAVAGLLPKVIREIGAMEVAIGPGVCRNCYQIGEEVAEELLLAAGDSSVVIRQEGDLFGDIKRLLLLQSLSEGIAEQDVFISTECTICEKNYFSFRRQKDKAGRQLSYIKALRA